MENLTVVGFKTLEYIIYLHKYVSSVQYRYSGRFSGTGGTVGI